MFLRFGSWAQIRSRSIDARRHRVLGTRAWVWLRAYGRGIVSRVRGPMNTGQRERINNMIKGITRLACGRHDSDHVVLESEAAFPSDP